MSSPASAGPGAPTTTCGSTPSPSPSTSWSSSRSEPARPNRRTGRASRRRLHPRRSPMSPIPEGAAAVDLPVLDEGLLLAVATGSYHDPHAVLGQHQVNAPGVADPVTVIRVLRPLATEVFAILSTGAHLELAHLSHGIWQGVDIVGPGAYQIEARYADGSTWLAD